MQFAIDGLRHARPPVCSLLFPQWRHPALFFLGRAEGLLAILLASPVIRSDNHAALALAVDAKHSIQWLRVPQRLPAHHSRPAVHSSSTKQRPGFPKHPCIAQRLLHTTVSSSTPINASACSFFVSQHRPQYVGGTVAGRLGRGPGTARITPDIAFFQSLPLPLSWPCMQPHLSHAPGDRRHVSFVQSLASTTFDIAPSIVGLTTQPPITNQVPPPDSPLPTRHAVA